MTQPEMWRHVPTNQNPTDCASRGLTPKELVSHDLWFAGPTYIKEPEDQWPKINLVSTIEDEEKEQIEARTITLVTVESMTECPLLHQSDN